MTDAQFTMLVSVIGAGLTLIGAAIRFSANRVVKALDSNSSAMLDNTKANAVLATKIDAIAAYVHRTGATPPFGVPNKPRPKTGPLTVIVDDENQE